MTPVRTSLWLALAAVPVWLVLIQPNHPQAMTWGAFGLFPLELPAILLALAALPPGARATQVVRGVLVAVLGLLMVWKAADAAAFTAFNRGFNPLIDAHLVDAGLRLAAGAVGPAATAAAAFGAVLAAALAIWALWWGTGVWAGLRLPRVGFGLAGVAALIAAAVAVAEIGQAMRVWALPAQPPGAAFTARVGVERVTLIRRTLIEKRAFTAAAAADPFASASGLFARTEGADVLIVFVESYARSSFDVPIYAETHLPTLLAAQPPLAEAGLAVTSGWLTAPIAGGQSWLAHGTLASGLTTDTQSRYGAMLAAPRRTLFHLARDAGFHTLAVAPAVVLPWPEADLLGFVTAWNAAALDYRGQPFNWVTMPDQFTLAALDRMRPGLTDAPVFAQVALISSHAPWTPVPRLIPWDDIGDGTEFDAMAAEGPSPTEVWADRDRVRDFYRRSLDYALQVVFDWAAMPRARPTLMVVLGDHPAAPFVALTDSRDVPVHLIGPPDLIAAFGDWGWTPGLVPAADAPVWPMADFRDQFLAALARRDTVQADR
jgi:hypothetical protein